MKMKYLIVFIFIWPLKVMAVGGEPAIILELKLIYANAIKGMQELKAQSDTLTETKKLAQKAYESYDYSRNFDIEKIKQIIESDVSDLTELDDMKGLSAEQRYLLLTRELNRRVEDPKSTSAERKLARADIDRVASVLKQEDLMNELYKNSTKNIKKSATDLSNRESNRIIAENLSVLARIETSREKDRLQGKRDKVLDNASSRKMLEQQSSLAKGSGW